MAGLFKFVVVVGAIWFIGSKIHGVWISKQRESIYSEVWKASPQLERSHNNLKAELQRLEADRTKLVNMQDAFTSQASKSDAGERIRELDAQIGRIRFNLSRVVEGIERLALAEETAVNNTELQADAIRELEIQASRTVEDSEALRWAVDEGIREDSAGIGREVSRSVIEPKSPGASEGVPRQSPPLTAPAGKGGGGTQAPSTERSMAEIPPAPSITDVRIWQDRWGRRVSARAISVVHLKGHEVDIRDKSISDLNSGVYMLHLEKIDGQLLKIPATSLTERDLRFLLRAGN